MGSRANAQNKAYGASAIQPRKYDRDAERAAMLAKVVPDPLTKQAPPGAGPKPPTISQARKAAKAARERTEEASPSEREGDKDADDRAVKRPAPRNLGGVVSPADMDDYLARVERGK